MCSTSTLIAIHMGENGSGYQEIKTHWPARIAKPTEEEVEKDAAVEAVA